MNRDDDSLSKFGPVYYSIVHLTLQSVILQKCTLVANEKFCCIVVVTPKIAYKCTKLMKCCTGITSENYFYSKTKVLKKKRQNLQLTKIQYRVQ